MTLLDYSPGKLLTIGQARGWFTSTQQTYLHNADPIFSFIDRTGTCDLGFKLNVLDTIPSGYTDKSFEECCQARVQELVALNKPLVVYWSGGIDSTLVLISLLKAGITDLTVVATSASIGEYPLFYETFIKDQLKVRRIKPSIFSDVNPDEVIVTGELGDQMCGSASLLKYVNGDDITSAHTTSWVDHVVKTYGKDYLPAIEPLVKACPITIKSAYDYLWWINIATKWQHVIMRMGNNLQPGSNYLENVQHFYRSDLFQQWSFHPVNHATLKIGNTWSSYKLEMKRLIGDFTGDRLYQQNKLKLGSLPTVRANHFLMLLDNGIRVSFGKASDDPVLYNELYGDSYDHLFNKES